MSALRLSLYQPREQSAYHPSHGTVDLDGAGMKVLGLRMKDADVPLWREVIKAITIELDLREVIMREREADMTLRTLKAGLEEDPDNPFLIAHVGALEASEGGAREV